MGHAEKSTIALLAALAELEVSLQGKHPYISYLSYQTTLANAKAMMDPIIGVVVSS